MAGAARGGTLRKLPSRTELVLVVSVPRPGRALRRPPARLRPGDPGAARRGRAAPAAPGGL